MLKRVLIANRGEIAARVARTCTRLDIDYVAVYSDADARAPHLRQAAASVYLGASLASESYLNQDKLIQAALDTGCDAIHPGYGFLSENAAFAKAVEQAGLNFIGPDFATIEALGDKARAKALMREAGVPTVPGTAEATEDIGRIARLADQVGFPVLLKPSAGGGGKGMQIVHGEAQLREAAEQGIRLARANFKDGRLLVERFVENPRHIEVQIFGDRHGNVVHLFERECSLQRRHQKVIEEAPAASLVPETRKALLEAAVRGAKALGYVNAGTFEFIVDQSGEFFFLEVNTRLQVEHPVSEEITGLDFVEWQLRVAAGEALPLRQDDIKTNGHAIECRIYAEDAANDFQPSPGKVLSLHWPQAARIETGIETGGEVSSFYDPMVAKLIVHAADRPAAIDRALRALDGSVVLGLTTNLGFLAQILSDPNVRSNAVHTRYLDQNLARYNLAAGPDAALACAAAVTLLAARAASAAGWPWHASHASGVLDRVHLNPRTPLGEPCFWLGNEVRSAAILGYQDQDTLRIRSGERTFLVSACRQPSGTWSGSVDGKSWHALAAGGQLDLLVAGQCTTLQTYESRNPAQAANGGVVAAPMPGVVVALPVAVGDRVSAGATLAIVEAMKMENRVLASRDGQVTAIHCRVGDNVRAGDVLVSVEAE
jgi:acetyl/propionyl-CoA carboxylase alpha subunit